MMFSDVFPEARHFLFGISAVCFQVLLAELVDRTQPEPDCKILTMQNRPVINRKTV